MAPGTDAKLPAAQLWHDWKFAAPIKGEAVPAGQLWHEEGLVAAEPAPPDPCLPAAHCVHNAAPAYDHEPAAQNMHMALLVALARGENVPAAQRMHDDAPVDDDQEPAGQF